MSKMVTPAVSEYDDLLVQRKKAKRSGKIENAVCPCIS